MFVLLMELLSTKTEIFIMYFALKLFILCYVSISCAREYFIN